MKRNPKPSPASSDPFAVALAALNRHRARYLVIAGRACVFYGAIEHTRDGDLWVELSAENLRRVRHALRDVGATPLFLPPLQKKFLERGHAAHFMLPFKGGAFRIDIMGRPPRVGDFRQAWRDAEEGQIGGAACKIVDVGRLVDMKKTQRDRDYEVIGRLAAQAFHYADRHPEARDTLGPWVVRELRSPELLMALASRWPKGRRMLQRAGRPACELAGSLPCGDEESIHRALHEEAQEYKGKDRAYWRERLAELRELRRRMKRCQRC